MSAASTRVDERIETAAQVLHARRHPAGHAAVCSTCRKDATVLARLLGPHTPTPEPRGEGEDCATREDPGLPRCGEDHAAKTVGRGLPEPGDRGTSVPADGTAPPAPPSPRPDPDTTRACLALAPTLPHEPLFWCALPHWHLAEHQAPVPLGREITDMLVEVVDAPLGVLSWPGTS